MALRRLVLFCATCGVTLIFAQLLHKVRRIVAAVPAQRTLFECGFLFQHVECRFALRFPVACVSRTSTTRPLRFSVSTCPR